MDQCSSAPQVFLDTFVCQANNNGTGYFFFEVRGPPQLDVYGAASNINIHPVLRRELEGRSVRRCRRPLGSVLFEVSNGGVSPCSEKLIQCVVSAAGLSRTSRSPPASCAHPPSPPSPLPPSRISTCDTCTSRHPPPPSSPTSPSHLPAAHVAFDDLLLLAHGRSLYDTLPASCNLPSRSHLIFRCCSIVA